MAVSSFQWISLAAFKRRAEKWQEKKNQKKRAPAYLPSLLWVYLRSFSFPHPRPFSQWLILFPLSFSCLLSAFISIDSFHNVCRATCRLLCPPGSSRCYGCRRAQCRRIGEYKILLVFVRIPPLTIYTLVPCEHGRYRP